LGELEDKIATLHKHVSEFSEEQYSQSPASSTLEAYSTSENSRSTPQKDKTQTSTLVKTIFAIVILLLFALLGKMNSANDYDSELENVWTYYPTNYFYKPFIGQAPIGVIPAGRRLNIRASKNEEYVSVIDSIADKNKIVIKSTDIFTAPLPKLNDLVHREARLKVDATMSLYGTYRSTGEDRRSLFIPKNSSVKLLGIQSEGKQSSIKAFIKWGNKVGFINYAELDVPISNTINGEAIYFENGNIIVDGIKLQGFLAVSSKQPIYLKCKLGTKPQCFDINMRLMFEKSPSSSFKIETPDINNQKSIHQDTFTSTEANVHTPPINLPFKRKITPRRKPQSLKWSIVILHPPMYVHLAKVRTLHGYK